MVLWWCDGVVIVLWCMWCGWCSGVMVYVVRVVWWWGGSVVRWCRWCDGVVMSWCGGSLV